MLFGLGFMIWSVYKDKLVEFDGEFTILDVELEFWDVVEEEFYFEL